MSAGRFVGQSVQRVEDTRLLTGRGRYTADLMPAGVVHAVFVRSPYPHAAVTAVDTTAARGLEGVVAVLTASDLASVSRPLSFPGHDASFTALADVRVRHVGDPVALVVAESRHVAEDARGARRRRVRAARVRRFGRGGAGSRRNAALRRARHERRLRGDRRRTATSTAPSRRPTGSSGRGSRSSAARTCRSRGGAGIAEYDPASGTLTYTASTQNPHGLRLELAGALDVSLQSIRVVSGDVGGGFGQKMVLYREDVAVCAAAVILAAPVRWIEDRAENLVASGQAREETLELEAAVRDDGTILALRGAIVLDQGAYPALPIPAAAYTAHVRALLPDCYRLAAFGFRETAVCTTKASYVPYRGPWASRTLVARGPRRPHRAGARISTRSTCGSATSSRSPSSRAA